ncbi:nonribosomal peptide synthetase 12 [Irpex rosettiformis]|uniref:Nonribosomal peptide synthetase 12 n=1 Tax=Irpex rosettiformis TaxID=378272 RepID=A0ACB8TX00_9APHY|nr:nonribosomal peptide synthetase 12 [Irpex rosettiformis]
MVLTTPAFSALQGISADDTSLFYRYGFGRRVEAPFRCIHHAFEHHAARDPDAVAVEHLGNTITYGELESRANTLAHRLRSMGVKPGSRVCLLVQRSIPMVVGIIAILKAGAAYVPLDGGIVTDSTLEFVLENSKATLVLALADYVHRVSALPIINLNDVMFSANSTPSKPQDLSSPDDSAYIIYTSGTTGTPKGVEVMHRNVVNLICHSPGNVEMRPGRRVSQLLNIAFDMAAWEILGSLSNGSTLCVRGNRSKEWQAVLKAVDIVIATPSIIARHDPADYPNIKVLATAGEPMPQPVADRWASMARYYNSCGPTEITIVNTMKLHVAGQPTSIGGPTPNNNVYILDESMKAVPIGEPGVMWAGGAGISRGYIDLPEKTAERYKLDPFTNDGSYMFNTGDLGRWLPDGTLEHLGRVDDQVKVKGFRVELDGVSAAMQSCKSADSAVALLIDNELWGFVTPASANVDAVIEATKKIQPYYAVPTQWCTLDQLPHTANGKIDKRALKQLAQEQVNINLQNAALEIAQTAVVVEKLAEATAEKVVEAALEKATIATSEKAAMVDPSFYANNLYSKSNASNESNPTMPPPVYSSTAASSEKNLTFDAVSAVEKESHEWDGYEDDEIPDKIHGKRLRNLRYQILSLYRRLFGVIFVTNMAVLIWTLARPEGADAQHLGLVVVSNLFCAILMRQDYVINAFFTVACAVPSSWPLFIRRTCARVYHIGGFHSGCAISGLIWLIAFTGQATRELVTGGKTSAATVAVTYFILTLLIGIVLFAYPKTRTVHHDAFERTHRFLGWSATALVWVQVVLLANDYKGAGQSLGHALVHSAPLWLVTVMTASIILPWVRLRKVEVRSEVLSKHAVRLHFDYVTPKSGHFVRLSESPLMEWHGFACIPVPKKNGFSLIVSRAGDWTNDKIINPRSKLWVRGVPCYGVLRITPLFRRVVFVATGSGIGPCAPCIFEQRIPIKLLWTSPNVRETFGNEFVDDILKASPGAVVYDTRKFGKPDMVKLTYRLVKEFNAEAVCIISNQKLTQKVVYGMASRGIPAFGAIWDS